jgi:hypothetical protein
MDQWQGRKELHDMHQVRQAVFTLEISVQHYGPGVMLVPLVRRLSSGSRILICREMFRDQKKLF